jgi:hypothetical protein
MNLLAVIPLAINSTSDKLSQNLANKLKETMQLSTTKATDQATSLEHTPLCLPVK